MGVCVCVCYYQIVRYEQYADICAEIVELFEDSEAEHIVLCGDFNCRSDSQFSGLYTDLINNLNLVES